MNYFAKCTCVCALLLVTCIASVQAQHDRVIDVYAAGGFRGTIDRWPNSEIRGIGAGFGIGADAAWRLTPRFGAIVGAAAENRYEHGNPLDQRYQSGAVMEWLRAGVAFYPPEVSWVYLFLAPALVRIDLTDPKAVGDAVFIFDSLREKAMWHRAITFGGGARLRWRTHYQISLGVEDFILIWNTGAMERRMRESPLEAEFLRVFGSPDPRWPHLPRVKIGLSRRLAS